MLSLRQEEAADRMRGRQAGGGARYPCEEGSLARWVGSELRWS